MGGGPAVSRKGRVELPMLFDGFRHAPRSQVALGIVYLACLAAVLGGSALADEGGLARWMLTGRRPEEEVLQSDEFALALVVAAGLYAPVMMMFWFAPPLAAWHSVTPGKSLFFSFFACLMNWRAFLAYGAATAAVALVAPFLLLFALRAIAGAGS